jgi:hypothetical protein
MDVLQEMFLTAKNRGEHFDQGGRKPQIDGDNIRNEELNNLYSLAN